LPGYGYEYDSGYDLGDPKIRCAFPCVVIQQQIVPLPLAFAVLGNIPMMILMILVDPTYFVSNTMYPIQAKGPGQEGSWKF